MSEIVTISETQRVQNQTNEEWLAEYNGASVINKSVQPQVTESKPENIRETESVFSRSLIDAGISSVRFFGKKLLITTDRNITHELDNRVKQNIQRLSKIAESDTGESLYEYVGYRTSYIEKKPILTMHFKEVVTGAVADRYFNIGLRNKKDKNFKTGENGEFRIIGNPELAKNGMFIKVWMDAAKWIPDRRVCHIYRYMKSKLAGAVFSCSDGVPHHGIMKLRTIKYEGHLYDIE